MRVFLFFLVVSIVSGAAVVPAWADSKIFWGAMWPSSHWDDQDYQPYIENTRWHHTHRSHDEKWSPQTWIERTKGGQDRIAESLIQADVIDEFDRNDQNRIFKNCPPILKVGEGFHRLSPMDKRRVMKFADLHYGITANTQNPFASIRDKYTKDEIGLYTTEGLQLH
jgi:hypothetical protein